MTPPINIDGTQITGASIDGQDVSEITVDGTTVFQLLPDAVIAQFEQAGSTNLTEATPYSVIAVASFDNDESGSIWQATFTNGGTAQLIDKSRFDLNIQSGQFSDLSFGTVSNSGLVIISTTFTNSGDSKIFVNGNSGGSNSSRSISVPDLGGTFTADDGYSNTFEETLVYNEDIDATGLRTDEEQRLANKFNITL